MLKQLNRNKKKKGFTLIELVIVLAVLAIIALIAIPNFTKVRNDSLMKSDARTAEQIEKITLMAIADEDIKLTTAQKFILTFNPTNKNFAGYKSGTGSTVESSDDYAKMLSEVKKPQVNGEEVYEVEVTKEGVVTVTYDGKQAITGTN